MSEDDLIDRPLFRDPLNMAHKLDYIRSPKHYDQQAAQTCIICRIVANNENTPKYEIFRDDRFIIFLNLFPYTSGHVMISPLEHLTDYNSFDQKAVIQLGILTQRIITVLKKEAHTESFNVGWNEGYNAGGSIKHFHEHIVPRYPRELNFIEIIGKTRPVIESLEETCNKLSKYSDFINGKTTEL